MKAYIVYENPDWLPPLARELERAGVPFEPWFLHTGHFDFREPPPEGVFLNRISPSAHTRGHSESIPVAREILAWLEAHGRRVVNGSRAFDLEISKVRQYTALEQMGIATPRTIAVTGAENELKAAARQMLLPFITKHNCGGKGMGVQLFKSLAAFDAFVDAGQASPSPDGITLLQEYVEPRQGRITRVEIVDGRFLYAINVSTERGFELCPAETCTTGDAFCPAPQIDEAAAAGDIDRQDLFSLYEGFADPIIDRYIRFMAAHAIDIAGIEFIEDRAGRLITYDMNANTNYSPGVEARHGLNGMAAIAQLVRCELERARG